MCVGVCVLLTDCDLEDGFDRENKMMSQDIKQPSRPCKMGWWLKEGWNWMDLGGR